MNKALLLLICVFICDLLMPLGVALGLLYIICIFLVVKETRRKILIITSIASVLTIIKFAVYFQEGIAYYFVANRVITILTLWIAAGIAIKYSLLEERQKLVTELERKTRETEQFIYIASHDLNEPLRTIKSMTHFLEDRYSGVLDSQGTQFLFFINSSIERMSALISSLLDYGRLGKNSVMAKTDCNRVVAEVRDDLQLLINETDAHLKIRQLPTINAYESELRLLFQNLISNAIKFRRADIPPVIAIGCKESKGMWLFSVSDNGIGIEKENLEKIFTIFRKLHSREEYPGTGIGLAHCRKIVELHHGEIWADSKPGKGTTFYFTIPNKQNLL